MEGRKIEISAVSAVYEAESCIEELHQRLTDALGKLTERFEIVLVEDGSRDGSWERIQSLAASDSRLRGIQLSRNFGQHSAIVAGLVEARGSRIVVLDCDLQDPPEAIPRLIEKANEGYEVVLTRRILRKDSYFKHLSSRAYSLFMNVFSERYVQPGLGTLSLLDRRAVDEYIRVADSHSHYLQVLHWLGFRQTQIDLEQAERFAGSSSYSLRKLVSHALNGLVSQSTRLLHISTGVGFLFGLIAVGQIVYLVYQKLARSIGIDGWASLMVVLWFVGGSILCSLGVIGLYLGRLFERTKARPLFIVRGRTEGPG